MEEIWKDLVYQHTTYPNYEISNLGHLRNKKTNRILKPSTNPQGYLIMVVKLVKEQPIKGVIIHRAVAETFIENTYNKEQVNHIDGNKHNNSVVNLEWCTRSENMKHAVLTGLRTTHYCDGEKAFGAKLTKENVSEIKKLYFRGKCTQKTLAKMFGCSRENIGAIVRGYSWKNVV